MIFVVSGAHKRAKQAGVKLLLDPRIIQNFLFQYIDARMRTEKFTL